MHHIGLILASFSLLSRTNLSCTMVCYFDHCCWAFRITMTTQMEVIRLDEIKNILNKSVTNVEGICYGQSDDSWTEMVATNDCKDCSWQYQTVANELQPDGQPPVAGNKKSATIKQCLCLIHIMHRKRITNSCAKSDICLTLLPTTGERWMARSPYTVAILHPGPWTLNTTSDSDSWSQHYWRADEITLFLYD